jgi:hypothetical protein
MEEKLQIQVSLFFPYGTKYEVGTETVINKFVEGKTIYVHMTAAEFKRIKRGLKKIGFHASGKVTKTVTL